MKVIIYTTNLGGYDKLQPSPKHIYPMIEDTFEYLYFTDGEAPEGWTKVEMKKGDRKDSRFYKINSHLLPPHDISIYLDACYFFKKPLHQIIEQFKGDIAISKHGKDTCVYQHAGTCLLMELDNPQTIAKQIGKYANAGLPRQLGLTENSFIIRRNNGIIKELNELWWKEYVEGSQRDQLSLPYALWKVKPNLQILPFSARDNKWLGGWSQHNKSNKWILNK
jgi:hypothetical protein